MNAPLSKFKKNRMSHDELMKKIESKKDKIRNKTNRDLKIQEQKKELRIQEAMDYLKSIKEPVKPEEGVGPLYFLTKHIFEWYLVYKPVMDFVASKRVTHNFDEILKLEDLQEAYARICIKDVHES